MIEQLAKLPGPFDRADLGPFDRVREANEPERYRLRPKFLSFQRADLYVVESRHEVCGDLCRFLFRYGVGRILFTSFKHLFERTAVLSRASVPEQLDRHGWNRQEKGDQERSEGGHD